MYCWNCGKEIDDKAYICTNCGVKVDRTMADKNYVEKRANPTGILGFIFSFFNPLLGLILSIIGYHIAKNGNVKCKGLSLAGIIISTLLIALVIISISTLVINLR